MSQQSNYNPEVLSGVSETVTATAWRLRELTEAAMLETSLKIPEQPTVSNIDYSFVEKRQKQLQEEEQRQATQNGQAGTKVDALSLLARQVDQVHIEKPQNYPDFRNAA